MLITNLDKSLRPRGDKPPLSEPAGCYSRGFGRGAGRGALLSRGVLPFMGSFLFLMASLWWIVLFSSSAWAIRATGGDGQIQISWIAPTKNVDGTPLVDLAGYNIYRGTSRQEQNEKINKEPVSECSFIDRGLKNGQTYYYIVKAVDFSGNESPPSELVFATPTILPPAGFMAIGADSRIKLFWEEGTSDSIRGYHLYRTLRPGQDYQKITSVPIECTYFEDHEVKNGLRYYYVITSVGEDGMESPRSEEREATPMANPVEPSDLKATYELGKVRLEWPASSDSQVVGYNVYRRESLEEKQFQKLTENPLTSTSYVDEAVEENKRYLYSVVSVNKEGRESLFPLEVSCYTQALYIASISEDTQGKPKKAGDVITLIMRGEPGCQASFTIEGLTENQPMRETGPGVYYQELTVPSGINLSQAPVWGCLADPQGNRSMKKAAGTISIKNDPPPPVLSLTGKVNTYGQPELSWTLPAEGSFSAVEVIRSPSAVDPNLPPPSSVLVKRGISSYVDDKAESGAVYYYALRTVDEAGNRSKLSEPVRIDLAQYSDSPAIFSVTDDTLGIPVKTGRIVTIKVEADRGCEAYYSIEGVVPWTALEEVRPGIYRGEYKVRASDRAEEAALVARVSDRAGRQRLGKGAKPLRINVQVDDQEPPVISKLSHNGSRVAGISGKLVAGDRLEVILSGEPGAIAFFSLGAEGKKIPMQESRFIQGEYQGSYVIQIGDDADKIAIFGYLSDQAGNLTTKSSDETLSIDTRSVITVSAQKQELRADNKSQAKLTVEIKDANGNPVSGHHVALTLATTDEYTDVIGGGNFGQEIDGKLAIDFEGVTDSLGRCEATYTAGFAAKTALIIAKDLDSGQAGVGYITSFIESSLDIWLRPRQRNRALAAAAGPGDAARMILSADPPKITADGRSRSRISVRLLDSQGKPVSKKYRVSFSLADGGGAEEGSLQPQSLITDSEGCGYIFYQAGKNIGTVTISAVASRLENPDGAPYLEDSVSIILMSDAPAKLIMTALPDASLEADSDEVAEIALTVTDINENPNPQAIIQLRLQDEQGRLSRNGELSALTLQTNRNGQASCTYRAGREPGLVQIRGRVSSEPPKERELCRARGSLFVPLCRVQDDEEKGKPRERDDLMDSLKDARGRLLEWLKTEGDEVRRGEPLARIEIERHGQILLKAPGDGRLVKIKILRGEEVLIGQTIGFVELSEE